MRQVETAPYCGMLTSNLAALRAEVMMRTWRALSYGLHARLCRASIGTSGWCVLYCCFEIQPIWTFLELGTEIR